MAAKIRFENPRVHRRSKLDDFWKHPREAD